MAYRMACRTGRLSDLALSWASRFCQDGALTVRMPGLPWNDFQTGADLLHEVDGPERSNWAAVVSSVTTRNTTFL